MLVMEHVDGVSIGDAVIGALPQEERNEVRMLLEITYLQSLTFGTYIC